METFTPIGKLQHSFPVGKTIFSPDGQKLATASKKNVRLWDVETLSSIGKYSSETWSRILFFSAEGQRLTSVSDGIVRVWDVENQKFIGKPLKINDGPENIYPFPNGKLISTDIVWNIETRKPINYTLPCFNFSPNGKWLVCKGDNNTVMLWDAKTFPSMGQPLQMNGDFSMSWGEGTFGFSPDSKLLAIKRKDGVVVLWDIDPQSWLKLACRKAGRNLSQDEWKHYLPDEPYQKTCPQYPEGK